MEEVVEKGEKTVSGGGQSAVSRQDVITYIEHMTVLELSEFIRELEGKFGVTAAMPLVAAAAPSAGEQMEAVEQTEFDVVLSATGDKKIQVIKVVRSLTTLGLKEAKDLVDQSPKVVKSGVSREEAENIKKQLEEAGATVEIK